MFLQRRNRWLRSLDDLLCDLPRSQDFSFCRSICIFCLSESTSEVENLIQSFIFGVGPSPTSAVLAKTPNLENNETQHQRFVSYFNLDQRFNLLPDNTIQKSPAKSKSHRTHACQNCAACKSPSFNSVFCKGIIEMLEAFKPPTGAPSQTSGEHHAAKRLLTQQKMMHALAQSCTKPIDKFAALRSWGSRSHARSPVGEQVFEQKPTLEPHWLNKRITSVILHKTP